MRSVRTNPLVFPLSAIYSGFIFLAVCSSATAADVADFYRGKQIRLIVGEEAGTSYDTIARALTHRMSKYIPGNPTVVTQNMVGAGTRVAANWLYNLAPRDGTILATLAQSTPLDQALQAEGIKFNSANFIWIGTPVVDNQVVGSTTSSGLATIQDVKIRGGLICAGTNASNSSIIYPQIINNLVGTKIRVVPGYSGPATINMAMERNEVNCFGSNTWATLKSQSPELLDGKKINILVQWGPDKDPDISAYQGHTVPLSLDLANSDIDRKVLDLIDSAVTMGRPLLTSPGVPADRVEALRKAFAATMTDPDFLEDAAKLQIQLKPKSGDYLQSVVTSVTGASSELLDRMKVLIAPTSN